MGPRPGRHALLTWPAYNFLRGFMKSMVHETGIGSKEDLVAHIVSAAAEIRETPGIFGRVQQSMVRRCLLVWVSMDVCSSTCCDGTKNWIRSGNSTLEWAFFFFFSFIFFWMKYVLFLLVCKVFGLTHRIMWHRMTYLHIPTSFHPFLQDPLALKRSVAAHTFLNKIWFNESYLSGPKVWGLI